MHGIEGSGKVLSAVATPIGVAERRRRRRRKYCSQRSDHHFESCRLFVVRQLSCFLTCCC